MNNLEIMLKIKTERKSQYKSQQYMADLLAIAVQTYSDIERGIIQLKAVDLYRIALDLGKPIDYFFECDTEVKSND